MNAKEIEKTLKKYVKDKSRQDYKKKALEEWDKIREKFTLDEVSSIGFIINKYPNKDHFLLQLYGDSKDDFCVSITVSRDLLISHKDKIPEIAQNICNLIEYYKAEEDK